MSKYRDEFLGVIFAIMLLNIWYLSGVAIENKLIPNEYKNIIGFFTSAFGAMTGAYAAFQFNRTIERSKKEKELIDDLRHAIFLLAMKLNQLRGIKKDMLDPFEQNAVRWGAMRSFNEVDEKDSFNIAKLCFLQDKFSEFLMELDVADDCYKLSIRQLNYRSMLHRERLQEFQSELLKEYPDIEHSYQNMQQYISTELLETMVVATNSCYQIIPQTIEMLENAQSELLVIAKERFAGAAFLDHDALYQGDKT
ncbi:hypothetical protein [Vibrio coralliilyticus]|uniref:hypothetical protein n=1 Tax=Vibrio coralliilyticus TaxID=190893 RepID=UPI000C1631EA|nr:hypothetical protein [Vibrio coralliilyticus]